MIPEIRKILFFSLHSFLDCISKLMKNLGNFQFHWCLTSFQEYPIFQKSLDTRSFWPALIICQNDLLFFPNSRHLLKCLNPNVWTQNYNHSVFQQRSGLIK